MTPSVFDPDDLAVLASLFEEAWASIAADFKAAESTAASAARARLAKIMLDLAQLRQLGPEEMKRKAIRAFRQDREQA
jgi:hypothetical protein